MHVRDADPQRDAHACTARSGSCPSGPTGASAARPAPGTTCSGGSWTCARESRGRPPSSRLSARKAIDWHYARRGSVCPLDNIILPCRMTLVSFGADALVHSGCVRAGLCGARSLRGTPMGGLKALQESGCGAARRPLPHLCFQLLPPSCYAWISNSLLAFPERSPEKPNGSFLPLMGNNNCPPSSPVISLSSSFSAKL